MVDKRQCKSTEKAYKFFSNVKKVIKQKPSQELTSRKFGKRPTTVVSNAKDLDSPSVVSMVSQGKNVHNEGTPTSTPNHQAFVWTKEEEALHSGEDVVENVLEDKAESLDSELGKTQFITNTVVY